MAPMIDMVFLLLVFFMCVSSLSRAERSEPVDLPESAESEVPEALVNRWVVTVREDGRLHMGGAALSLDTFRDRVAGEVAARPGLILQVRADAATPYRVIRRLLRACAEAGAYEVIYSTHQT